MGPSGVQGLSSLSPRVLCGQLEPGGLRTPDSALAIDRHTQWPEFLQELSAARYYSGTQWV
jgi:hypothetical protein